jgi:hypothetical protein
MTGQPSASEISESPALADTNRPDPDKLILFSLGACRWKQNLVLGRAVYHDHSTYSVV